MLDIRIKGLHNVANFVGHFPLRRVTQKCVYLWCYSDHSATGILDHLNIPGGTVQLPGGVVMDSIA